MPNFTEGEWRAVVSGEIEVLRTGIRYKSGTIISGSMTFVANVERIDDARLMAQSKKMYEAMARMLEDFDKWGTRDMGEDNFEEVRAILYEIDKE
jgi:hypothetical protein